MDVIEVPDILVYKNGELHSLRGQKIVRDGKPENFGPGSGIVKDGKLYVLDVGEIVKMTSLSPNPVFEISRNRDIQVDWGDGTVETNVFSHTYTDGISSHNIIFKGENNSITGLRCSFNQLTNLDIQLITSLTYLDCRGNQLKKLDISKNELLTHLNCHNNQLTTLDVSKNILLTHLDCYNNQLVNLEIDQNVELLYLDCSINLLTKLSIDQNRELNMLACYINQLADLDITQNINLITLKCHANPFMTNDVSLVAFIDTLPDRNGVGSGEIWLDSGKQNETILSICNKKNWKIVIN